MLREPRPVEKTLVPRKDPKEGRFRLVKLEERIAPACHTNPQGNEVGNCSKHGGGHGGWV
jgi:hypothetical protein